MSVVQITAEIPVPDPILRPHRDLTREMTDGHGESCDRMSSVVDAEVVRQTHGIALMLDARPNSSKLILCFTITATSEYKYFVKLLIVDHGRGYKPILPGLPSDSSTTIPNFHGARSTTFPSSTLLGLTAEQDPSSPPNSPSRSRIEKGTALSSQLSRLPARGAAMRPITVFTGGSTFYRGNRDRWPPKLHYNIVEASKPKGAKYSQPSSPPECPQGFPNQWGINLKWWVAARPTWTLEFRSRESQRESPVTLVFPPHSVECGDSISEGQQRAGFDLRQPKREVVKTV
ncbi:hypothetical protein B0H16DRAFT_1469546 [Mycena metata]|uniref:Uncharacterized protein n=1 Tax=Mycena metata TaxID=1033252 RepID=A0AAD7HXS1_9AGAR|nr:hypothetical protein B0H16DRAFT_1469546 [Mycena metata]